MYTLADDIKRYRPPILLSRFLSRRALSILRTSFLFLAVISGLITLGLTLYQPEAWYRDLALGICLLAIAGALEQIMLWTYHNNFFFFGLNSILGQSRKQISGATYEVAEALLANEQDVTQAFCNSALGSLVLLRSGLSREAVTNYLAGKRPYLSTQMIPLPTDQIFTLISLGRYLWQQDGSFSALLKAEGVTEESFFGALRWTIISHHADKKKDRWWGKDNLSQTPGIGRQWAYGTPYYLEKFSRDLRIGAVFANLAQTNSAFTEEKITEVTIALARAKAANVLLIAEAGVGAIDLLLEVEKRLQDGKAVGAVEHQRMILLDTTRLFATHRDRQELELTLLTILNEAAMAGNIIIVIENMSSFIREAEAMGVFVPELLDPYLASPAVHIIGTDTPGAYHTYLEPLGAFARRFAEVLLDTPDLSSTINVLQDIALKNEGHYQVLFTYPALSATASAADRYLVEGAMPDKAIELMLDIAARAAGKGGGIIDQDYVYEVVGEKTGIPVGPIDQSQRDLLLNIEERLSERVIGQKNALESIARTMRRARAGIQSQDKPIGSFLFLGPTGVGKTETAKALAQVFFGNETNMHRLDMSEYSGPDALMRFIGNADTPGILPSMLREDPYCVLLLDEFEKATRAIHDLFLQVLDEGIFTDGRGEKVNARNTIIIATSNAGSDLILRTVAQRQELSTLKDEIINHIVNSGVYRPELINRFDSTIIFEPLTKEEQGQVAGLMLRNLYDRIKERGYELTITRELLEALVVKGYDPQFGARPMQRLIQDVIEEKVAAAIISGAVNKGGVIALDVTALDSF